MSGLLHDLRFGFRLLAKNPAFTSIAVLILAFGIGANTAIFSVVHAVLLKSLPYPDPETLVLVWGTDRSTGLANRNQVSAIDIADVRMQNGVFEEITTYTDWRPIISGIRGEAERVPAMQVGDGYFKVMRAEPQLGRLFFPEEQQEGKDFVIVLSHSLWQRRFGADPHIIGKQIRLNLRIYTIVGVLKPEVQSLPSTLVGARAELYRPVAEPYDHRQRDSRHLRAIARLKPGISLQRAQAELNTIGSRLEIQYPDDNTARGFRAVAITEDTVGGLRPSLLMLTAAAGFLLLIACANLANLLLTRAASRHREIAIRTSLGAPRWRLVRQLLVESGLLMAAGGTAGVLLAKWSVHSSKKIAVNVMPLLENVQLDTAVLGFTALVSMAAGLLFGLVPALNATKLDLNVSLKEGGRSGMAAGHTRIRNILVGAEVALALLLLTGAGLLIQSVARLYNVNPGFDSRNVLTMNVWLPFAKYEKELSRTAFFHGVIEKVERLPGVQSAGTTSVLPLSPGFDGRSVAIEGQPRAPGEQPNADMYVVTPGYLSAMRIPLVRGRYLSVRDDSEKSPFVALVNESMAKAMWHGDDPIGKRFRLFTSADEETPWREVVGVVSDVKHYGLDTQPPMQFYILQSHFHALFVSLAIRYSGPLEALVPAVRKEILSLDPDVPVWGIATLDELLGHSVAVRRLTMALLVGFAFLALGLAMAGIYGVVSFATTMRTQEIGIRMALGAEKKDVIRLVLKQGLLPAVIGGAGGLAAALLQGRLIKNLLFEISPTDPITLSLVTFALLVVAAIACYIPARKAAQVNPVVSLRYE